MVIFGCFVMFMATVVGIVSSNSCQIHPQENLDIKAYLGEWYLLAGYNTGSVTPGDRCGYTTLVPNDFDSETSYKFFNKAYSLKDQQWHWVNGTCKYADPINRNGHHLVTVNSKTTPYYIVSTDYKTYSIVASCSDDGTNEVSIWLVSRTRQLLDEEVPTKELIHFLHRLNEDNNANMSIQKFQFHAQIFCDLY